MDKTLHGVSGRLMANPGQGAALRDILLEAARGMAEVDGCLCYIVSTPADNEDAVHVYEVWRDAQAHQASLGLSVFQSMIAKARPLLAGMENDPDLRVYGGKAEPLR